MYDRQFTTDWDSLTIDEAMVRAFALGVAETLGYGDPEEYDRLRDEANWVLIEMAFNEGRRKSRKLKAERAKTTDDVSLEDADWNIWSRLIRYEGSRPEEIDFESDLPSRVDIPATLRRVEFLTPERDAMKFLELPDFLYRK